MASRRGSVGKSLASDRPLDETVGDLTINGDENETFHKYPTITNVSSPLDIGILKNPPGGNRIE